ncbi:MAG: VTT domain-containing protein [Bacteroidia bacterium]
MKRFWIFAGILVLTMLVLFFVGQALHLPFLEENPDYWLGQEKWVAGMAGMGLLVADVVAPVPSSIIMFANGVLFGVILGSLLSIVGGLGASLTGYWIGTRGEAAGRRWMGDEALRRAKVFFERHGMVAVVVSRPIPILAEAIGIIAGLSGMSLKRVILGSLLGLLPAAVLYAIAGAYAVDFNTSLLRLPSRVGHGSHCLGHRQVHFAQRQEPKSMGTSA